jgi:hypothetical protein
LTSTPVYGIDLGTTYTCIAHVDDTGRPVITPNVEGELTTPSVVLFEDAETRVVGREAKNTAILDSDRVIEMVKRQMGKPEWRQEFFGREFSPEEISSYILRKVADDVERHEGVQPHKVVITCPAYFGIPQREATAKAGQIAGLEVLEIINELGGRDWDEQIVKHLAAQWTAENPGATTDPLDSPETVQDLWLRAESGKRTLSAMAQARVPVTHDAKQVAVTITRAKFDELTRHLLESTITLTNRVIDTARELGCPTVDRMLLVGGSTKMPQVSARLQDEFDFEITSFEPDQAVAKGAAIYGQKLVIGELIRIEIGKRLDKVPEQVDPATAPVEVRKAAKEKVAEELGLRLGTVERITSIEVTNEALRLCEDFEAARTELARMPPEPPRDVHAAPHPTAGVLVRWQASPDPDVSYVVVRGTGARPPESVEDLPGQQLVGVTTATTWPDRSAIGLVGVPLTYAIFTKRSGTFSAPAAAAPVVVAADANVRRKAQDGQAVVTWSVLEHAVAAEVVRQTIGDPASPIVLDGAEQGRLVDTDVRNGVHTFRIAYSTVRIAYSDPAGGRPPPGGRSQGVTPRKRPAPPGPLIVTGVRSEFGFSGHKTQIRWPPPERGIVKVVRQAGSGSLRNGDRHREGDLRQYGRVLEGTPPLADFWIDERVTRCSYVPVLVLDGVGHVGRARRYALAPEPSDLQGEFIGAAVRLGWAWPEGHDEALVGYDATEQPLDPTVARGQVRVGRLRGDHTGGCDIPAARDERLFVIVATVVKHDGIDFATSGVPLRVDRPTAR